MAAEAQQDAVPGQPPPAITMNQLIERQGILAGDVYMNFEAATDLLRIIEDLQQAQGNLDEENVRGAIHNLTLILRTLTAANEAYRVKSNQIDENIAATMVIVSIINRLLALAHQRVRANSAAQAAAVEDLQDDMVAVARAAIGNLMETIHDVEVQANIYRDNMTGGGNPLYQEATELGEGNKIKRLLHTVLEKLSYIIEHIDDSDAIGNKYKNALIEIYVDHVTGEKNMGLTITTQKEEAIETELKKVSEEARQSIADRKSTNQSKHANKSASSPPVSSTALPLTVQRVKRGVAAPGADPSEVARDLDRRRANIARAAAAQAKAALEDGTAAEVAAAAARRLRTVQEGKKEAMDAAAAADDAAREKGADAERRWGSGLQALLEGTSASAGGGKLKHKKHAKHKKTRHKKTKK